MPGATFKLVTKYAAAAATVSDGVMTAGSKILTSATAGFTKYDEGKKIVIQGAGAAGADLTTHIAIGGFVSTTEVVLVDAASTTVNSADLTYVKGVYQLRELMRTTGDIDGNKYDFINASRLQLQVNSASPGKVFVGGRFVTITNAGVELAPGDADNSFSSAPGGGVLTTDFVTSDADNALLNVYWNGVSMDTPA